jgi:hypothetical protein
VLCCFLNLQNAPSAYSYQLLECIADFRANDANRIRLRLHSTLVYFAYMFTGKERDTESGLDYFGASTAPA